MAFAHASEVQQTGEEPITYTVLDKGSQRGSQLLVESSGYSYTLKRKHKTSTEWRCSVRNKQTTCRATIRQTSATNFVPGPILHCHEYLPELLSSAKVKAKVERFEYFLL